MRIGEISISGYRSLRAIRFPVGGLTVFVGANGVGKPQAQFVSLITDGP